jgi:hypothetical protein
MQFPKQEIAFFIAENASGLFGNQEDLLNSPHFFLRLAFNIIPAYFDHKVIFEYYFLSA